MLEVIEKDRHTKRKVIPIGIGPSILIPFKWALLLKNSLSNKPNQETGMLLLK